MICEIKGNTFLVVTFSSIGYFLNVLFLLYELVQLKIKKDPEPGDCRSKQLDMLPVTFQGLPKDSALTKKWHDPDICDESSHCPCKKTIQLGKEDIRRVIFDKTEKEETMVKRLDSLMNWSLTSMWRDIKRSKLWHYSIYT